MKNRKTLIALLLMVAMMATLFAGCGKKIDVDQYSAPKAEEGTRKPPLPLRRKLPLPPRRKPPLPLS